MNAIKIIILGLGIWMSSCTGVLAQTPASSNAEILTEKNLTYSDFEQYKHEVFSEVVQTNLGYLGIAVAIIAIAGAAVFLLLQFVVLQPQKNELKEQREELSRQKRGIEESERRLIDEINKRTEALANSISSVEAATRSETRLLISGAEQRFSGLEKRVKTELEGSFTASKKKIDEILEELQKLKQENSRNVANLRRQIDLQEVVGRWQDHYLWETKGVWTNVITSIVSALEKDLVNEVNIIRDLALDTLIEKLPKLSKREMLEMKSSIESLLLKIKGYDKQKASIHKLISGG